MTTGLLESARNLLAGILDLGRTRFELFSTELREELERLSAAIVNGIATLIFAAIGLSFVGAAIVLSVDEGKRPWVTIGVALFFLAIAAIAFWRLRRLVGMKPHPFDATIAELRHDLRALKS
jgi:uncharacterized membrane protein YqjE